MLLSQLLGERYREKPSDASIPSHIFMLKGGYIRQVANGIFSLLPPTKRGNYPPGNGPYRRSGSIVPSGAAT